jgi:hypothetical protein
VCRGKIRVDRGGTSKHVARFNVAILCLRLMRLHSSSLDLELLTGRVVGVPLVWASCGVMGERVSAL